MPADAPDLTALDPQHGNKKERPPVEPAAVFLSLSARYSNFNFAAFTTAT